MNNSPKNKPDLAPEAVAREILTRHLPNIFTPRGEASATKEEEKKRIYLHNTSEIFDGRTQAHAHWYAPGEGAESSEHVAQIAAADNNPRYQVRIYKVANPNDQTVHRGDRVTLSYLLARRRGSSIGKGETAIVAAEVDARRVYTHLGRDLTEWTYDGPDVSAAVDQERKQEGV